MLCILFLLLIVVVVLVCGVLCFCIWYFVEMGRCGFDVVGADFSFFEVFICVWRGMSVLSIYLELHLLCMVALIAGAVEYIASACNEY